MNRLFLILLLACVCPAVAQTPPNSDSVLVKLRAHTQRDTTYVLLLNQLAFASYYIDPMRTLQSGFEARQLADSLDFTRGQADAFRQIGMAYWAMADFSTAIDYYLTGLRIAKANNHHQVEADILGNIGTAYNSLGNFQEAMKFLTESVALQHKLKNEWREAASLNNLGDAYAALGEPAKAYDAYNKAMIFADRNGYKLGVSTNTRNIGNLLERAGNLDSAMLAYQKALSISSTIKDSRGVILSQRSIASIQKKRKQYLLAEQTILSALEVAKKMKMRQFAKDCYEMLSEINEARGNQPEAYKYFKLFDVYKDSLQFSKTISEVAAARIRFETNQKQTEIELLKKDRQIQDSEIRYQRAQIWIFSVCLGFSLVFLGMTVFSSYRIKEKNKQIEQMNAQIKLANQRLEELVQIRTKAVEDQNERLSSYSFFNAHELRSPVSSIMGLVSLMQFSQDDKEREELLIHLEGCVKKLDDVIREFTVSLNEGIKPHS